VKAHVGMKATISLPDGRRHPGIVISDESATFVTKVNPTTNAQVTFPVTRVDIITLRETREGVQYLALTSEVVQYGYRPIMEPRFSTVIGLDASPEGERLDLQTLIEAHGVTYAAWQAANYAARNQIVAADEL